METRIRASAMAFVAAFIMTAGCTPQARQDVDNAGSDLNAAAVHSAEGTKKAIDTADAKVKADSQAAAADAEHKLAAADRAVSKGANAAVQDTERAAAKAAIDTRDTAALLTLTPKVKAVILADDRVKIPDLDVDTKTAQKEVVVNGTAPSAAEKGFALSDAKAELKKANPNYTLVDHITVGAPKL